MLIDCHAHVYANPLIGYYREDKRFNSVEEQIAIMDRLGVDKAVILPLTHAETAAEPQSAHEILSLCAMHPGRFIPFCAPDPRSFGPVGEEKEASFELLLRQFVRLGFRGIGEYTARLPWDVPCVTGFLKACRLFRLPIIFHTVSPDGAGYGAEDDIGLHGLKGVLRAFPEIPFVGHSPGFWSEISADVAPDVKNGYPSGPIKEGGAMLRLLRSCPNLYCDISAGSGLNALKRDPDFTTAFLREFSDRLLFGLDACGADAHPGHVDFLKQQRESGVLSDEEYGAIASGNLLTLINRVECVAAALPEAGA